MTDDDRLPPISAATDYVGVTTPRATKAGTASARDPKFGRTGSENGASDADTTATDREKKKKQKDAGPDLPLWQLYRFATPFDVASVALGCVMAAANGALFPQEKAQEEAQAAAADLANAREATTEVVETVVRKSSMHSIKSDRVGDHDGDAAGDDTEDLAKSGRFSLLDAMAFSRPERKFFVTGMVTAGINGFALPCSAILISEMVATMTTQYAAFQD
ncbi:hypothetical protein PybrP1_000283, partial [[Pythium] brassicae (nom. inval.)]